jgi:hypothetical protein
MKTLTSIEGLEARIEQVVREHIEVSRAAAAAAVARAFCEPGGRSSKLAARQTAASTRRPMSRRRTREEVAELAERFCAAVQASPGETMNVLAPKVGATPSELSVAVAQLRRADRVRIVGQRHQMKYFPAACAAAAP